MFSCRLSIELGFISDFSWYAGNVKNFAQIKRLLNKEQRQAVEMIEGPVMVLAGPGTGKTQVVAVRIAEILSRTHALPRNILALTFTEAGTTALRTRLESIIGAEAYQVTISTFHGFANEVIGTFPYIFELDETSQQLTELERYLILEEIVAKSTELKFLRPLKTPTAHVRAIGASIKTCKQEALWPKELKKLAEDELLEINKAEKLSKLETERRKSNAEKNIELAKIYERYQNELKATQRYDYEDMILLVVQALKTNDELRLHYQERYQYFLVDEYQDTNNGQNALIETLASFFPNPNLFVVGDDKQAIYRFQGASVANMLHFAKRYQGIQMITLKTNYRSTPEIIVAASEMIKHNQHQLGAFLKQIDTGLEAARPSGRKPLLVEAPTIYSQYDYLIKEIQNLVKSGQSLSEMAVLFRINAEVRDFRRLAEKHQLLVSGTLNSNLINEPEIQLLLTVLQAINNPHQTTHLLPTLRALSNAPELIELLEVTDQSEAKRLTLSQAISRFGSDRLKSSLNQISLLGQQADKSSLVELFELIISQTNILEQTRLRPERIEGLELISAFLDEMRRFSLRRPRARLKDFLNYIELLKKYHIQLTVNRVLPERNGLFVSTVHGAKGLEFETVFMPNIDETCWSARKTRSVITLPSQIVDLRSWNEDPLEDDRRLFYVGLTRAKRQLYLTMAKVDGDGREILPCQFIAEMIANLERKQLSPPPSEVEKIYETAFLPIAATTLKKRELAYIRERITTNPFSFTDLKTYQLCPKQYLLRSVFRLPSEPTIPLVYGNAVHRALELFFRAFKASRHLPLKKELTDFFRLALSQQPPVSDQQAILKQGQATLSAYYDKLAASWQLPVGIEYSFRPHHVMLDNIWLTGKFDRLDVIDPTTKSVRVVDYKTVSRAKSRNEIEGQTKNSDGSLKKQLVFYSLLADLDRLFPYRATEFLLSFIDDKAVFKEEIFVIEKPERASLAAEITNTYNEILKRDRFDHTRDNFDQGCEICGSFPSL